jgi:hypothetical protein
MIGKDYFSRQAVTLLKLAGVTSNPTTAAALKTKAADLQAHVDEAPIAPDVSPVRHSAGQVRPWPLLITGISSLLKLTEPGARC